MSIDGIVGIKEAELEAKINELKSLSDSISVSAANASVIIKQGPNLPGNSADSSAFIQSKGAATDAMGSLVAELGRVAANIKSLIHATEAYLSGVKETITSSDQDIANKIQR